MIKLDRILSPTDFSELATHALRYACDLARTYRAELHVLHVVTPTRDIAGAADAGAGIGLEPLGGVAPLETAREILDAKARELARHLDDFSGELAVRPVGVVRAGVAWEQVARYAEEVPLDLVVIGSHARGVMKRIFLGSTSKAVLEHVAAPVLMVPIACLERLTQAAHAGES